jgi:hypothetical protein
MSHSFNLSVRVNQEEPERLHAAVDDEEWNMLASFLDDFERLAATRVANGGQVKVRLEFDARSGFSSSGEMPPDDDVAAFLHRLRPFVLNDERSNFYRVCNVLGRSVGHRGITAMLQRQRDEFSGKLFQSQIQITSNHAVVNSEKVLQNWLNAYEYHRDAGRRDELAKIHHEQFPLEAIRPVLFSMLIDKARAIAAIADVVRVIVKGSNGQELHFDRLSVKPNKSKTNQT